MQRALRLGAIPVTFIAGGLLARALLRHAPASIAPDRAQPLLVVTAWGAYGASAFAVLAATLMLATIALGVTLRAIDERTRLVTLLAVAAASAAACATWPFLFSSDVYAYAAYGDLATRGIAPYVTAPGGLHDAILDAARWQWSGSFPPCVYGPAFVALAAALVSLAHACAYTSAATLAFFRGTAALAFLATIACAYVALGACDVRARPRTLALASLNPVVLWSIGEGHNDVYALLVVAAVAALARGRLSVVTQALVPLGMLVKASAGLPAIALGLELALVRRRAPVPVVLATLGGMSVAAVLALPPLLPALRAVAGHGHYAPTVSLPGTVGLVPALAVAVAFGLIAIVLLSRGGRAGYAWLGLAAFAALPNPYPWYGVLLVPLALASGPGRAGVALYAATICAAVRYLPDAYGDMTHVAALAASALALWPLGFALLGLRHDLRLPQKDRPAT